MFGNAANAASLTRPSIYNPVDSGSGNIQYSFNGFSNPLSSLYDYDITIYAAASGGNQADFSVSNGGKLIYDSAQPSAGYTDTIILQPGQSEVISLSMFGYSSWVIGDSFTFVPHHAVVPLPAAIWLFLSGAVGVFFSSTKNYCLRKQ